MGNDAEAWEQCNTEFSIIIDGILLKRSPENKNKAVNSHQSRSSILFSLDLMQPDVYNPQAIMFGERCDR